VCRECAGEVCCPRVSAGDIRPPEADGSAGPEGPSRPELLHGGTGTGTAGAGEDYDGLGVVGSEAAVLLSAVIVGRMARGRRGDLRPPVGRDCLVDDSATRGRRLCLCCRYAVRDDCQPEAATTSSAN
jgi:hypothetical protein